MQKSFPIIPLFLTIFIAALIVWSGINPSDRAVWYAEIIPVSAVFIALIATYRRFRFSNTAYVLMSMWMLLHMVGAHYTFANVPFEAGNRLLEQRGLLKLALLPSKWKCRLLLGGGLPTGSSSGVSEMCYLTSSGCLQPVCIQEKTIGSTGVRYAR